MMRRIKREGEKKEKRLAEEKKQEHEYWGDWRRGWEDAFAAHEMNEIDRQNHAYFRGYITAWEQETGSEWTPPPTDNSSIAAPDSEIASRASKRI